MFGLLSVLQHAGGGVCLIPHRTSFFFFFFLCAFADQNTAILNLLFLPLTRTDSEKIVNYIHSLKKKKKKESIYRPSLVLLRCFVSNVSTCLTPLIIPINSRPSFFFFYVSFRFDSPDSLFLLPVSNPSHSFILK